MGDKSSDESRVKLGLALAGHCQTRFAAAHAHADGAGANFTRLRLP